MHQYTAMKPRHVFTQGILHTSGSKEALGSFVFIVSAAVGLSFAGTSPHSLGKGCKAGYSYQGHGSHVHSGKTHDAEKWWSFFLDQGCQVYE